MIFKFYTYLRISGYGTMTNLLKLYIFYRDNKNKVPNVAKFYSHA